MHVTEPAVLFCLFDHSSAHFSCFLHVSSLRVAGLTFQLSETWVLTTGLHEAPCSLLGSFHHQYLNPGRQRMPQSISNSTVQTTSLLVTAK